MLTARMTSIGTLRIGEVACVPAPASLTMPHRPQSPITSHRQAPRVRIPQLARLLIVWCHAGDPCVVTRRIIDVALRRIAIDQRPHKKRMSHAAHLVLDGEQGLAGFRIGEILESVLMLIAFFRDESLVEQL